MRYAGCLTLLFVAAGSATAADDYRVTKLEQDVRNLERQVGDLQRQVGDLQRQLAGATTQPLGTRPAPAVPQATAWLVAENWKRVRPGMGEIEVIGILGKPTTTRVEEGARVMFYATEVGPTGLLAGRVTLRDGKVTDVAEPELR